MEASDVGGGIVLNDEGGVIVDIEAKDGVDLRQAWLLPPTHEHPDLVRFGAPQQPQTIAPLVISAKVY